jgi:hypothetical protein
MLGDDIMADATSSRPTYAVDFIPTSTRNGVFLGNPVIDNMMHAIIALGAEVWADKRRLKIIESLLEAKIEVTRASIEAYMPTPEQEKAWAAERDLMIKSTFGALVNAGNPPATGP